MMNRFRRGASMNGFMTVKETSMKWGVSERQVQKLCRDGKIEGVAKLGRNWLIPANAEKPIDKRITSGNYKNWRKKHENVEENGVW